MNLNESNIFLSLLLLRQKNVAVIDPKPETLEELVKCLAWYFARKEITQNQIDDFMKTIEVGEHDPALVMELYTKYCSAIHTAGFALEKKLKE
jgi:hypothetical protein